MIHNDNVLTKSILTILVQYKLTSGMVLLTNNASSKNTPPPIKLTPLAFEPHVYAYIESFKFL